MTGLEKKIISITKFIVQIYNKYLSNKYIALVLLFFMWMLIFDNDNIVRQFQRKYQVIKLNREIKYYTKVLEETKIEEKALNQNNNYFEKFVREKYLMKKPNEDLFIFSEEE